MNENNLHEYQKHAVKHILDHPEAGLFLGLGLGKTVSTLTAIANLLDSFEVSKVLIIAPKRVAEHTWAEEIAKWEHTKHLTLTKILGTAKNRKEALKTKADLYVINRENVPWLVTHLGGAWPFDTVVIDELSSFKSAKSQRFKALRAVRPKIARIVGLTGTPAPNGLLDLWPQMYLLDRGERLGKSLTKYRDTYFNPGRRNGYVVYDYKQKKDETGLLGDDVYEKEIYDKIGDICISMKARDYLELPERMDVTRKVHLPAQLKEQYDEFEKTQVLNYVDALGDKTISAQNAAGLVNKLLQFANGAVYDGTGGYYEIHNEKIEALAETLEAANGKPVLVLYSFQSDVERIKKHLKAFKPHKLSSNADIEDWNAGKINVLLGHPASMGHGLNLQFGGHLMAHFGLNWSLELYLQAIGRLDRQGQKESVINTRLICPGTYDPNVLDALDRKDAKQNNLLDGVKALIGKYKK